MAELSNILSQEAVSTAINTVLQSTGGMIKPLFIALKGLACSFLLLNWVKMYVDYMDEKAQGGSQKSNPVKPSTIVVSVLYILLILNAQRIVGGLEEILLAFEKSFPVENSQDMYNPLELSIMEYGNNDSLMDAVTNTAKATVERFMQVTDIFWWVLTIIKCVAWLVNVILYPTFLIYRGFLLLMLQITLPLVLALGALEKFRPMVWGWLKLYTAIYLTGLLLMFVTYFCDQIYLTLSKPSDFGASIGTAHLVKTIVLIVVISAKAKLYPACFTYSEKIFKS